MTSFRSHGQMSFTFYYTHDQTLLCISKHVILSVYTMNIHLQNTQAKFKLMSSSFYEGFIYLFIFIFKKKLSSFFSKYRAYNTKLMWHHTEGPTIRIYILGHCDMSTTLLHKECSIHRACKSHFMNQSCKIHETLGNLILMAPSHMTLPNNQSIS
jgi:hypothetical protein